MENQPLLKRFRIVDYVYLVPAPSLFVLSSSTYMISYPVLIRWESMLSFLSSPIMAMSISYIAILADSLIWLPRWRYIRICASWRRTSMYLESWVSRIDYCRNEPLHANSRRNFCEQKQIPPGNVRTKPLTIQKIRVLWDCSFCWWLITCFSLLAWGRFFLLPRCIFSLRSSTILSHFIDCLHHKESRVAMQRNKKLEQQAGRSIDLSNPVIISASW